MSTGYSPRVTLDIDGYCWMLPNRSEQTDYKLNRIENLGIAARALEHVRAGKIYPPFYQKGIRVWQDWLYYAVPYVADAYGVSVDRLACTWYMAFGRVLDWEGIEPLMAHGA